MHLFLTILQYIKQDTDLNESLEMTYIPLTIYPRRASRYYYETPTFYENYLVMKNTAEILQT
jgi:hypothetical protein